MKQFKIGDRVSVNIRGTKHTGTVVTFECGFIGVETDEPNYFKHSCNGCASERGRGYWATQSELQLIETDKPNYYPTRKFTKGSQNYILLQHLLSGKTITRITADHLYRVASLTRRIRDLRDAGHKIISTNKVDPTGRPYVEYSLRKAGRV